MRVDNNEQSIKLKWLQMMHVLKSNRRKETKPTICLKNVLFLCYYKSIFV